MVCKHRLARVLLTLLGLALSSSASHSENLYPSRPIRVIVKAVAGGLPDTVARIVAQNLQEGVHQPVIVENRPGANGSAAVAALNGAPADGYTFVIADGSLISTNRFLYQELPYDPKDLLPVSLIARAPIFIAVSHKLPVSTMQELVDYIRANPGRLNYGSSGIGSAHHLTMEAIKADLHLDVVHVPYKGTGESIPALIGGYVEIALAAYPALKGFASNSSVKLLATNGPRRSPIAPEVPPVSDIIPDFDFAPVIGIFARVGTAPPIVEKVAQEIAEIVKRPEAIKQFADVGIEPVGGGPSEFATALEAETARVAAAVKAAKIEPQ